MAYQIFKLPKNTQIDSSVRVTPGAKAYFYTTLTTTPQDTFTTSALNVAHPNPVVADANGVFPAIYLDPALVYKLTLTTSADVLIYTVDPVNDQILSQAVIGQYLYPRTDAEVTAGVTPTNYGYPALDVRRYGVTGDGSDEHEEIQTAIDVAAVDGGNVTLPVPPVEYGLGTVGLTVPQDVMLIGDTSEQVWLNYTGTGFAIDFTGLGGNGLVNAYVICTNPAASGLRFGNDARRQLLRRVTVHNTGTAASRTGAAVLFRSTASAVSFSGNFLLEQFYALGFPFGLDFQGNTLGVKTWTCVVGSQVFLVGPGAGVVAGSRGIRMDALTNGVGSSIFGGTIELFEAPIEVANGGFGINYYGDIEGNTSDLPLLAVSFCGEIVAHPTGVYIRAGANNTANKWFRERHLNGVMDRESHFGQRHMVYNQNTANRCEWFCGAEADSLIEGGTGGDLKFAIQMHPGVNNGERNWIEVCGHKMAWGSAPPTINAWSQGDVTWNTGAAAAGSPGWVCTTGGTPGTWKAMAAVAA